MADIVDAKTRSRMMAGIQGQNTRPELTVRRYLHQRGFRFRLHVKSLPGRPDIVLSQYRTVVEVRGCFWHQHPGCRFAYSPKTNRRFWRSKLGSNSLRDARNETVLKDAGWRTIVVWECEATDERKLDRVARRIVKR